MVIGGVKSDQDPIQLFDMVVNEFKNYNFPIIKVDFFGHYTKEFYPLPIGRHAVIDTSTNRFALES